MTDIACRLAAGASPRLRTIAEIALAAGALSLAQRPGRHVDVVEKGARDYQTAGDVAVERLIVGRIRDVFHDYAIWGEEQVGNRDAEGAPQVLIDQSTAPPTTSGVCRISPSLFQSAKPAR